MPKRRQKSPTPVHPAAYWESEPACWHMAGKGWGSSWCRGFGAGLRSSYGCYWCSTHRPALSRVGVVPTTCLHHQETSDFLLLRASPSQKCPSWGLRNSPGKSTLPEPVLPVQALLKNSQISKGKPNFKKMEKEGEETQTCADRFTYQRQAIHGEEGNLCLPSQILTACTTLRPLCSVPGSGEACPGSPWPRGERGSGGWPACSGTRLAREPLERRTTVKPVPQKNPVVNSARSNALGFLSAIALCVGAILRKKFCLSLSRD